jgi:hypothetical protein
MVIFCLNIYFIFIFYLLILYKIKEIIKISQLAFYKITYDWTAFDDNASILGQKKC